MENNASWLVSGEGGGDAAKRALVRLMAAHTIGIPLGDRLLVEPVPTRNDRTGALQGNHGKKVLGFARCGGSPRRVIDAALLVAGRVLPISKRFLLLERSGHHRKPPTNILRHHVVARSTPHPQ